MIQSLSLRIRFATSSTRAPPSLALERVEREPPLSVDRLRLARLRPLLLVLRPWALVDSLRALEPLRLLDLPLLDPLRLVELRVLRHCTV